MRSKSRSKFREDMLKTSYTTSEKKSESSDLPQYIAYHLNLHIHVSRKYLFLFIYLLLQSRIFHLHDSGRPYGVRKVDRARGSNPTSIRRFRQTNIHALPMMMNCMLKLLQLDIEYIFACCCLQSRPSFYIAKPSPL